ncbi:RND family transporter [Magnetospirillum sp. SS-4]|uniref:efflux RND transporter permease subunit n=1 Tax=Magnetospirillum sp. SS-4 TaxID=2681465 RepID=UPI00137D97A1|nr:efflux RND transporter permease subunit [Magnetospirillum sp. SS-4]CAA7612327.1 RND efflux transporter [Magnetospirillum sp. SS-4]
MLKRVVDRLGAVFFENRAVVLAVLTVLTVVMGYFGAQLKMSAGFDKQLPSGHEYIQTFERYRGDLFGANRVIVVLRPHQGDVWTEAALRRLFDVTQAVMFLPGVDRRTVQSLWTPNTRSLEITEEGLQAEDVIGGDVTPDRLSPDRIARIRDNTVVGGYIGSLVARDGSAAMVVADLLETDPVTKRPLDYLDLNRRIETEIRERFGDERFQVQIIGFVKQIGDIADSATSVLEFFALAFVLTIAAVYWYTRSKRMTFLPLVCSLVSLVWQFGTLTLLGYGLDPLAILVPFLVFAIGVSHGVQQVNAIAKEVAMGVDGYTAARTSFTSLLIPGTLALVTAFVGFATLTLIPIPMIRELGITASIGVAYKIVTNLVMLPVVASCFSFPPAYTEKVERLRRDRERWMSVLARVAERHYAWPIAIGGLLLMGLATWQSQDRQLGHVTAGVPELRADSRYNLDAASIADNFDIGLDVLTVVFETPKDSCGNHAVMSLIDRFGWEIANQPDVISVLALPNVVKVANSGLNEGHPKRAALPYEPQALTSTMGFAPDNAGLFNQDCTVLASNIYLSDHKAETIKRVVAAVKAFRTAHPMEGVTVRLASGNAGIQGAINEVLEITELPMMLWVYATIVALVFITYRDWRATVACCVPLTLSSFLGYWFMKELSIGLTVATLPVMVLAVGIGVDYAFYIYNRLQFHLAHGIEIVDAFKKSLMEVGVATIFTALTLSIGIATWSFSALKFQADMGLLLTFMFMINMLMAITLLPALAVVIDTLVPRTGPIRAPLVSH